MRNLNILVDCHVFDQSYQGTTSYIKGLYLELIKDKTKTFFFISNSYNLEEIFKNHENVKYLKYSSKNKFYRLLIELPKIIKKNKIDYAHFQYIVPPIKKCKYIVTLHDVLFLDYPNYFPFLYKFSKKILYKFSAKRSDIVLTVSEYSKRQIQKHFKIQNIYMTPNAIDKSFFDSYDKEKEKLNVKEKFGIENYFLFVSRWEPRKNHDMLLKVFVENGYFKKYNLVFVGVQAIQNKKYDDYYKTLSDEIQRKIFKLKMVTFQEILMITRAARLSVYPSIAEGFGIPPLESLASNIPTICSNTTAMSDFNFMKDFLFDPLDPENLSNIVKVALACKNFEDKKTYVKQNYNWELGSKQLKKAILENIITE